LHLRFQTLVVAAFLVALPSLRQLNGQALESSVEASSSTPSTARPLFVHSPTAATRLLVLSPHPDDATLGAAGLIQRVVERGGAVRVVLMTSGDAFGRGVAKILRRAPIDASSYRFYGTLREREDIRAMRKLGVHRSQVRLLGFPDEGLCVLASRSRSGKAFKSPYTTRTSPPDSEQVVRGTMYRGVDLEMELEKIIEEFRPTLIVLPHPRDEHPDHCATHLLGHNALATALSHGLRPPRVLHYMIHFPHWPPPNDQAPAQTDSYVVMADTRWESLKLSRLERATKQQAILIFHSQMEVMPDFLTAFARPDEAFFEGDPASLPPCWCGGENITASSNPAPVAPLVHAKAGPLAHVKTDPLAGVKTAPLVHLKAAPLVPTSTVLPARN
jgi:LmbE family N-acetylglucosaminyl deacetylase